MEPFEVIIIASGSRHRRQIHPQIDRRNVNLPFIMHYMWRSGTTRGLQLS